MCTSPRTWSNLQTYSRETYNRETFALENLHTWKLTPLLGALPGEKSHGQTPLWRWPVGQGQLYGWTGGTAWLPRVTERECTKGLPRESIAGTRGLEPRPYIRGWRASSTKLACGGAQQRVTLPMRDWTTRSAAKAPWLLWSPQRGWKPRLSKCE
jgi:hypothetical protein